jgi:hypothetical protein
LSSAGAGLGRLPAGTAPPHQAQMHVGGAAGRVEPIGSASSEIAMAPIEPDARLGSATIA